MSRACANIRRIWLGRTRPRYRFFGNSSSPNHPTSDVSRPVVAAPPHHFANEEYLAAREARQAGDPGEPGPSTAASLWTSTSKPR